MKAHYFVNIFIRVKVIPLIHLHSFTGSKDGK